MIQATQGATKWNSEPVTTVRCESSCDTVPDLDGALFKKSLATLRRIGEILNNRNATQQMVGKSLADLVSLCEQNREELNPAAWQSYCDWFRAQPIYELLIQDPISQNGLQVDSHAETPARLLDHIFSIEHGWALNDMTWIGRRINNWIIHQGMCDEVRERRDLFAQTIDRVTGDKKNASVLAFAAGHLREAELSTGIMRRKLGRIVAVDPNSDHLALIQREYGSLGVAVSCQSAVEFIKDPTGLGTFDLIYAPSLCDDHSDRVATDLVSVLFHQLNPRGKLLLSGSATPDRWAGYREAVMNWQIHYRNRIETFHLTAGIHDRYLRSVKCHSSPSQMTHYLLLEHI